MSEEFPVKVVDWRKAKKTLMLAYVVVTVLTGAASFYFWGPKSAALTAGVVLCLALGFWFTEMIIGVFTQTIRANPTAIVLMLLGKFGWWAALIIAARHIPPGSEGAIGLGMAGFLLALSIAMIRHYGMPRISDGNPPSAP